LTKGQANPLNSAFHLTYNMVLNLLRVEGINPEFMLQRSFFQFQNYANIPAFCESNFSFHFMNQHNKIISSFDLLLELKKCEEDYNSITFEREHEIAHYFSLRQQIESLRHQMASIISLPRHIINFMTPGRLIHVISNNDDFGWGVVINFRKRQNNKFVS
jgi:ATP-dependent RNA helicase DOB1